MEWAVTFMGPVGAGKTTAIRTISDIAVVNTDERATDEVASVKQYTTVSMDVGALRLEGEDKIRLYGTPGQDRFDFMWDILLDQSKGVLLMINHAAEDSIGDLNHYMKALDGARKSRALPVVVCLTHCDKAPEKDTGIYQQYFRESLQLTSAEVPPVLRVDARSKSQVRAALVAMTALLEMAERFPKAAGAAACI